MTRGRKKVPKPPEPQDLTTLRGLKAKFCEWMTFNHRSEHTLRTRGNDLEHFLRWCDDRSLTKPTDISRAVLEHYRKHLYQHRRANNKPLSISTQIQRLIAVRVIFQWMERQNYVLYSPASSLEVPRQPKRLPTALSIQEIEQTINNTNISEPLGLRDRAIMETFYSTGIRRGELIALEQYDISLDKREVRVRHGKGDKERIVPIGERACQWLDKYLLDARPHLVAEPDNGMVFLTIDGEELSPNRLTELVGGYLEPVCGDRYGACHLFRHAMATHMLDAGADLRVIQVILGHESLSTTEIYTHVSIQRIKEVHAKTHPAASIRPVRPTTSTQSAESRKFLSELAAEAAEEESDD